MNTLSRAQEARARNMVHLFGNHILETCLNFFEVRKQFLRIVHEKHKSLFVLNESRDYRPNNPPPISSFR